MHRSTADTLAFFAAGLVHQFGNLLLTIQGHALNLAPAADSASRSREAILGASERGAATLRFLRQLLGEPAAVPEDAFALAEHLVELARVPVREARQLLEWHPRDGAKRCLVEVSDFVPIVALTLRTLVEAIPHGVQGSIDLRVVPTARTAQVRLQFLPAPGSLPFPIGLDELAARIDGIARSQGWRGRCGQAERALELTLPRTATAVEPSDGLHGSFSLPT